MNNKTVLVTGIGGNVGQGILRNIRHSFPEIRLIGTNTIQLSAGNHLCDNVYQVPFAYHSDYIPVIEKIVINEKVDLIIPSTDFEALYLSKYADKLVKIATSPYNTNLIFTDKLETYHNFSNYDIPFANSTLPSMYDGSWGEIIAKPRMGRGSRGILYNPSSLDDLSDQDYMVQKLYRGIEITTSFYCNKNGKLHGFITMERMLENGTTVFSLVTQKFDSLIKPIIEAMIEKFVIHGSCNIQSIVTSDGEIIPFEINGRISGTNSIRSNFGFEDVKYTLEEFLFSRPLSPVHLKKGAAVRILMDIVYPDIESFEELNKPGNSYYIF